MEPPPARLPSKKPESAEGKTFSLRPPPVGDRRPKTIAQFIERVHAERGAFRNISEASLREEIRAQEDGENKQADCDVVMGDVDAEGEPQENGKDKAKAKDLATARLEALRQIDIAHNTAMMTLDFVSLYISKEQPTVALGSLSKELRDRAGIGTLGSTPVSASNITPRRERDNHAVAVGWTLMDISRVSETARKAYDALEKETELEKIYWNDVLSATENGWSVCRLPQARHVLGVRYGFSEAAPEFRNNSLAPMLRGEDGRVKLDLGRVGGGCQRLAITCERDGKVISRATTSIPPKMDSPLEDRVLEARNTIFSQELWHELHKESHFLASYGVRTEGDAIIYNAPTGEKIRFELVTISENDDRVEDGEDNILADAIYLSIHMLLSHYHRQNEMMRVRPVSPSINRTRPYNPHHLIRPVIARAIHDKSVADATRFVGDIVRVLNAAGITSSSFVLTTSIFPTSFSINQHGGNRNASASNLMGNAFIGPIDFQLDLDFTPQTPVSIRGRTFLQPQANTQYQVNLNPQPGSTLENFKPSPILTICPPSELAYADLKGLTYYIHVALTRALVEHFLKMIGERASAEPPTDQDKPDRGVRWVRHLRGNSIRDMDAEDTALRFEIEDDEATGRPALLLRASYRPDGHRLVEQRWTWRADGTGNADVEGRTVEELVVGILDATARV